MKLALITDIHANREALEAVLDHAARMGCTQHAFLGDYVGYGADPGWVVDCVREHVGRGAFAVKGNHDAGASGSLSDAMSAAARHVVDWTRSQLSAPQHTFLEQLPLHQAHGEMLFVHANAFAPGDWAYLHSRSDALRSMQATDRTYTFCGHVHEPCLYALMGTQRCIDFVPTGGVPIPVPAHRRWLVLPGSTGQPRDGNPAASYASFDAAQRVLTFHRVAYDHESAAHKIRAAGLPDGLASRLSDGR